jgi:hypothetical protein
MNPLVTTIIPAYNAAATLRRAVASLLRDSHAHGLDGHEIIIVDDGSTDLTRDLAEELALSDDRVWVIPQPHSGVSAARNAGVGLARGDWIHFLDADDWMLEGGLVRLLDQARRSGAEGACAGCEVFDQEEHHLGWRNVPGDWLAAGCAQVGIVDLLQRGVFHIGSAVLQRRFLADHRFDPAISFAEDWDLWLRLAERGCRWSVLPGVVSARRLRRDGLSYRFSEAASSSARVVDEAYERCRRHSTKVVPAASLRHERRDAVVGRIALEQATAAALDDSTPDRDGALTIFISHAPAQGEQPTPGDLAAAACVMLPFADGRSPAVWQSECSHSPDRYRLAARAFWKRLEREALVPAGTFESASQALGGLCQSRVPGIAA